MKKTLIVLAALAMASVASAAELNREEITANGIADETYTNPSIGTDTSAAIQNDYSGTAGDFTMQIVIDWATALDGLLDYNGKSSITAYTGSAHWWPVGLTLFKDSSAWDGVMDDNLYMGFLSATDNNTPAAVKNTRPASGGLAGDADNVAFTKADYMDANGKLTIFASYDSTADTFTLYGVKKDGSVASAYISTSQTLKDNDYKWLEIVAGTYQKMDDRSDVSLVGTTADLTGVIDSITVFDQAMSADNIKYYMQTTIPEPATATLSLLALAGLAARRRRK